jgi:hypothetical protein
LAGLHAWFPQRAGLFRLARVTHLRTYKRLSARAFQNHGFFSAVFGYLAQATTTRLRWVGYVAHASNLPAQTGRAGLLASASLAPNYSVKWTAAVVLR